MPPSGTLGRFNFRSRRTIRFPNHLLSDSGFWPWGRIPAPASRADYEPAPESLADEKLASSSSATHDSVQNPIYPHIHDSGSKSFEDSLPYDMYYDNYGSEVSTSVAPFKMADPAAAILKKPSTSFVSAGLGDDVIGVFRSSQDSNWPIALFVLVIIAAAITTAMSVFLIVQKYRRTGCPQKCLCRLVIQWIDVFKSKKKAPEYIKLSRLYQQKYGGNYIVMLDSPKVSLDVDELSLTSGSEEEFYNRYKDRTISLSNLAINDTMESDDFNNSSTPLSFSTPKKDSILEKMQEVSLDPD